MPRKNRLTGVEIRNIRSPRRVHGDLFSVLVGSAGAKSAKCACVVSKKVAAQAHDRNKIKRWCRASLSKGLRALTPGAYIFHAKKEASKASFRDINDDIARIIRTLRGA